MVIRRTIRDFFFCRIQKIRTSNLIQYFILIICLLLLLQLTTCREKPVPEKVLFDFESDRALDLINWKCHTLFSLSKMHTTRGNNSLKIELFPTTYPGFSPKLDYHKWDLYKYFCFDIYNPYDSYIKITLRIDDTKEYPEYSDRYNQSLILKPGMNNIRLEMDAFYTSATKRKLNLEKIYRFILFLVNPPSKKIIFIDNVRLE